MNSYKKSFQLVFLLLAFGLLNFSAHPRIIKGTVYRDGKPAKGAHVTAHKTSASYFTSFDGKYELKISPKTKWIKFTFHDREEKIEIDANSGDIINFGAPAKNGASDAAKPLK
jgi:hypothetical protein